MRRSTFDEIRRARAVANSATNAIELLALAATVENFEDRRRELAKLLRRFLARLAFALVDDLERRLPPLFRHVLRAQKIDPELAIADPHDDIVRREAERAQEIDAERRSARVGLRPRLRR